MTLRFDVDNGAIVFASGKMLEAFTGIIGLECTGDVGDAFYGYDGAVGELSGENPRFTIAERNELADAMIAQWQKFKKEDDDDDRMMMILPCVNLLFL